MNKTGDLKNTFKFLDAKLLLRRIRSNPAILLAQNSTLSKGDIARYNLRRVETKTFTFSNGSKYLSIDTAVLGLIPKLLLFNVVKNTDIPGSLETNPCKFQRSIVLLCS